MRPIQHPSNNAVLSAPEGWDQQQRPCRPLPITAQLWDGMPCVVSFWKPSAEELAALNAGGSVALSVLANSVPPMNVDVAPASVVEFERD